MHPSLRGCPATTMVAATTRLPRWCRHPSNPTRLGGHGLDLEASSTATVINDIGGHDDTLGDAGALPWLRPVGCAWAAPSQHGPSPWSTGPSLAQFGPSPRSREGVSFLSGWPVLSLSLAYFFYSNGWSHESRAPKGPEIFAEAQVRACCAAVMSQYIPQVPNLPVKLGMC